MKAYHPKSVDTVRQARRWSFMDQQNRSASQTASLRKLKADLVACLDGHNRLSYLNKLKAQIDSGTYSVDSDALALKMLQNDIIMFLEPIVQKHRC